MLHLLVLLLLFDTPKYEPGAGRLEIAAIERLELEDTKRQKTLQLRITYPKGKGPYPVLVFSHGLWGSRNGYRPLVSFWSAHGYVCIQADHADSRALGRMDRTRAFMQWSQRPRDVSFILDSLAAIESKAPALKGKLDKTRIGVGGHSFGAHTSQLIGGATARGRSFKDKRAKCVLLLSPQGRGGLFNEDSWKTMTAPSLVLTGSKDGDPFGDTRKTPEWRLDPYKLNPNGDRYMVWIDGAHHGFGGISGVAWRGAGPKNEDQVKVVQLAGLALFDAYVKNNAAAKKWLASGALAKATEAKVKLATGSRAPSDPK